MAVRARYRVTAAVAILAILALAAVLVLPIFNRSHGSRALEEWVASEGFGPTRPRGTDSHPGTILYVSGGQDYLALGAGEFVGDHIEWIEQSGPKNVTLQLEGSTDATVAGEVPTPGAAGGSVQATGSGRATVRLQGVRTLTLPLKHIRDRALEVPRVRFAMRRSPTHCSS